ncbi:MAG: winged helix-turn-helix domain-containing protein [Hafnia sp.]
MSTQLIESNNDYYLIMDEVKFYPFKNLLHSITDNEDLQLFSTASRCFEMLLKHQGEVISQRNMMLYAWTEHGLTVSPNTFYQNISSLRKALSKFLPDNKIIMTIKRTGLVIPNDISVKVINDNSDNLEQSSDNFPFKQDIVSEIYIKTDIDAKENIKENIKSREYKRYSMKVCLVCFLSIIYVLFISTFLYKSYLANEYDKYISQHPFKSYIEYSKPSDDCTIYVNRNAGKIDPSNRFLKIDADGCRGYETVYVTLYEGSMRTSAMYCSTLKHQNLSCISEYFAWSQK